jgi:gamma-glutamyltranspeptidase/glutathione hydrolase
MSRTFDCLQDFSRYPYPSRRTPLFARNMVATSQPLAAQAGLDMLRRGGNAVDAALAAAIALTVVEPTGNGIGSDAFAMVWDGRTLHGLNASGRSPQGWSPQRFAGAAEMPELGWDSVTVPGAVSGWWMLWQRFGRLPFEALFQPAVDYAENGFVVTPRVAAIWAEAPQRFKAFPEFAAAFLPRGRAPRAGERFGCPDQARTLEKIAVTGGEAFYRGELAARIADHARSGGGALTAADLAAHTSQWVTPLAADYNGSVVHELPPNGQGLAALIALGILRHLKVDRHEVDGADSIHLQVEAMKTAQVETRRHVCDPAVAVEPTEAALDSSRLARWATEIRPDRARRPPALAPAAGGTVYLAAGDSSGMLVSYIQSNYMGFGSGIVVPGTGISLQNRGCGFILQEGHPNRVAGGKRPFHTIIPGFVTVDGQPLMSFGVMGGHMQPQGHVQMIVRMVDYGQNPQAAADAPRWCVLNDFRLAVEPGFSEEAIAELRRRGHAVVTDAPERVFGGAQVVARLTDGYCGASDPRKDGQAVGF